MKTEVNVWDRYNRLDLDKNYNKDNCIWANRVVQWRNKSNITLYYWKCLAEWGEILWLRKNFFYKHYKVKNGSYTIEQLLNKEIKFFNDNNISYEKTINSP